jgi:hypothetical protein
MQALLQAARRVGISRLVVRVNGPRMRATEHAVEPISGQVLGRVHRVLLYLNGTPRDLVLDGEASTCRSSFSPA